MKLKKIINIKKIMKLKTGLRIASGNDEIKIGGIDNSIVKDPFTGNPYIPGSSLKGVLRSSLEIAKGKTKVCDCGDCFICKMFGSANNDKKSITRIIVRDAFLTEKSRQILNEVLPFGVEIKNENSIDRVKGTSAGKRTFDRVPAGAEFEVNIVLKIFEKDDEEEFLKALELAFKLVEFNYVGGCGSRGYGQVEFKDEQIEYFDVEEEVKKVLR